MFVDSLIHDHQTFVIRGSGNLLIPTNKSTNSKPIPFQYSLALHKKRSTNKKNNQKFSSFLKLFKEVFYLFKISNLTITKY